ncbi:MAG: 3-deoxy-manno-octulosonate cytidylyltransferase [Candidatus Eisenbacteria bacterium]
MTAPRTLAIIPARLGSTRFPGKVLADLFGRPVLAHVIERARRIEGLHDVLVATDAEAVVEAARAAGAEARMTRADHPSGSDRIGEVVRGLDPPPDFVLNLQGDEPLLPWTDVSRMVQAMHADPAAIWTLAHPITAADEFTRPSVVKVVLGDGGRALYFSRAPIPHPRTPSAWTALRHVGVYGYPRSLLEAMLALPPSRLEACEGLEQLRVLEAGLPIRVLIGEKGSPGIDEPEDLERLKRAYPSAEALARA